MAMSRGQDIEVHIAFVIVHRHHIAMQTGFVDSRGFENVNKHVQVVNSQ